MRKSFHPDAAEFLIVFRSLWSQSYASVCLLHFVFVASLLILSPDIGDLSTLFANPLLMRSDMAKDAC